MEIIGRRKEICVDKVKAGEVFIFQNEFFIAPKRCQMGYTPAVNLKTGDEMCIPDGKKVLVVNAKLVIE